jgi:hypothetical protein
MAEKIGTISNRVFIKKLDQALQNGSISKKEYDSIKKEYFGKPKIIQMDLFDPDKKKQGGLMEATKRLKAQGLKSGGKAKKPLKKAGPPAKRKGLPPIPKQIPPRLKRDMTNQEKLDMINKMKKDQGKMVDESLKVDSFGNFYYEVKKGGRIKKFPDLSGDGKVTMKDILMGRGVIKKPKKKASGGSMTLKGGKLRGVKDAPEERRKERFAQRRKTLGALGALGGALGVAKGVAKVAGRLAKRGYGKARK